MIYPTLAYPIFSQSYPVVIYPIFSQSYPVMIYPIISYPILAYYILSYPGLSFPFPNLSCLDLSYPVILYPTLSWCVLSYPTLSYPILSWPILSYPVLYYHHLSYPMICEEGCILFFIPFFESESLPLNYDQSHLAPNMSFPPSSDSQRIQLHLYVIVLSVILKYFHPSVCYVCLWYLWGAYVICVCVHVCGGEVIHISRLHGS